jgi:cell wall-associated NlpC family hydrolase
MHPVAEILRHISGKTKLMIRKYFILIICGVFLSGCSAVSNRYVSKPESKEDNNSPRYTQNQDNKTVPESDSNYYDEDDDSDDLDEEIEPAPEDEAIDITEVMSRFSSKKNEDVTVDHSTARERTLMEIIKYLNTPYKFGGNSKKGIDCSAFTQTIYNNAISINLLRSAKQQYTQGIEINKQELKFGDLVFFNTRRRVRPGHVGIYIGDNLFAHASSKHGVIVSSLEHDYYTRTYMGARRVESSVF